MKHSMALVAVSGLFLLGTLVGALGMHLFAGSRVHAVPQLLHGHIHSAHDKFMEELHDLLELTPRQQEEIHAIIRQSHEAARMLHEEMLPRVKIHMDQTKEQILKVLTPEQVEQFEQLHQLHRTRAERFFLGH